MSEDSFEAKLIQLSISDKAYKKYRKKYREKREHKILVIDAIEIINPTYLSSESILKRLDIKVGEKLNEELLRSNLLHIYNMMIFDSIEYRLERKNDKNILIIETTPSWDNHGEIRFAIGIEDDFKGHSSYSLKLGYTMFGLNTFGGEWKNDFEIGTRKRAYTEIFQPLDSMQRYYIRPSMEYNEFTDLVPINKYISDVYGNQELLSQRYGTSLALGMHITTNYELEVGVSAYKDKVKMEFIKLDQNYRARPVYASFKIDNLDNIHFPEVGLYSKIVWTKEMPSLGSEYNYKQLYFELEKPFTLWSNNITAYLKYGNTYEQDGVTSLAGSYTLGGLFNLSGYAPYSLNNDNMALAVFKYRYEIKDGGFFGTLNTPIFAGFSLEIGDTWGKDDNHSDYGNMKKSGTIYLAADTFLGPFYLAYGHADTGERSFYLYLGEKF